MNANCVAECDRDETDKISHQEKKKKKLPQNHKKGSEWNNKKKGKNVIME